MVFRINVLSFMLRKSLGHGVSITQFTVDSKGSIQDSTGSSRDLGKYLLFSTNFFLFNSHSQADQAC